jgi:hypothetical protein
MKKLKKSKRIGNLDSTVSYEGLPPVKRTTANLSGMNGGYGSYDSRNQAPRGKGVNTINKRNRYASNTEAS